MVQLRDRSGRPLDACIREVLDGRSQITRVHLVIGAVTDPGLRDRLSAMPQLERDEVMRSAFACAFPGVAGASIRLGADRFAISGDEGVAAALSAGGRNFEAARNAALAEEVLVVALAAC